VNEVVQIGSVTYHKVKHGVFEVPRDRLESLRFTEIPYYSTVEVTGFGPDTPEQEYRLSFDATHAGGPHNEEFMLFIHVHFHEPGDWADPNAVRAIMRRSRHIRRFFRSIAERLGLSDGPEFTPGFAANNVLLGDVLFSRTFKRSDNPMLADYANAFNEHFTEFLAAKNPHLFICHASEDTEFVQDLCSYLDSHQVSLWYDRREIKVGDSIVQRISAGLESASHLVVVLSPVSVTKPWVRREFSSAVMRQIQAASVIVLPILAEPCEIPAILADIRYANASADRMRGFQELLDAL
jgi:hypothetical protein